jgi:hypothetical protein
MSIPADAVRSEHGAHLVITQVADQLATGGSSLDFERMTAPSSGHGMTSWRFLADVFGRNG